MEAAVKWFRDKCGSIWRRARRPRRCIDCPGRLVHWIGTRWRCGSVLVEGEVVHVTDIPCRRVRCPRCGKRWALHPPGLLPGWHFQLDVVAQALSRLLFEPGSTQKTVARWAKCSVRTLRRWRDWVAGVATPAELQARLLEVVGEPVLPELQEVADLERKAPSPSQQSRLRTAARVLSLLEALGRALGLEAPGLRGVLVQMVGDRTGVTTLDVPRVPGFARRQMPSGFATLPM